MSTQLAEQQPRQIIKYGNVNQSSAGTAFSQRGLEVATMDQAWSLAERLAGTKFVPKGMEKPADIFGAIMYSVELGIPIMTGLQSVAVINGRPSVFGDTALGLVRASGKLEWIREYFEGEGEDRKAVCEVKRDSDPDPVVSEFSIADARRANLWKKTGPWTEYPQRMMKFRARGFALRDAFGDVLRGLYTAEEAMDMPTERNVTPQDEKPKLSRGSGETPRGEQGGSPGGGAPSDPPKGDKPNLSRGPGKGAKKLGGGGDPVDTSPPSDLSPENNEEGRSKRQEIIDALDSAGFTLKDSMPILKRRGFLSVEKGRPAYLGEEGAELALENFKDILNDLRAG